MTCFVDQWEDLQDSGVWCAASIRGPLKELLLHCAGKLGRCIFAVAVPKCQIAQRPSTFLCLWVGVELFQPSSFCSAPSACSAVMLGLVTAQCLPGLCAVAHM